MLVFRICQIFLSELHSWGLIIAKLVSDCVDMTCQWNMQVNTLWRKVNHFLLQWVQLHQGISTVYFLLLGCACTHTHTTPPPPHTHTHTNKSRLGCWQVHACMSINTQVIFVLSNPMSMHTHMGSNIGMPLCYWTVGGGGGGGLWLVNCATTQPAYLLISCSVAL